MEYPRISIVTPSYNQAQFLEDTICSVLDQNYPNLEYVVIDGGSSDGSVEIIKKYEKYLSYWVSERDEGHGNALNKGFAKTSGEIMAWINSDDKYFPRSFFHVAEIFQSFNDINWITGKTCVWNEKGDLSHETYVYKNVYDFLVNNYKWIEQETTFWRRSLWVKAGGYINEQYKLMVDGELWTRFFLFDDLWHVNMKLGGYRLHTTNRANIFSKEVIEEMEKAVLNLKSRIKQRKDIYNHCKGATSFSIFTNNLGFLDYGIVDFVNGKWIKEKINYFSVKLNEENNQLIKYIGQKLREVAQNPIAQNTYDHTSLNVLYKEWMDAWMILNRGISRVLYRQGVRGAAIFGTKTNATYLWRDLTKEEIKVICFIDNDPTTQGKKNHNIDIVAPKWLSKNQKDIDAVIISIEGEHDVKVKEQLKQLVGDSILIMSWKDLIIANRYASANDVDQ